MSRFDDCGFRARRTARSVCVQVPCRLVHCDEERGGAMFPLANSQLRGRSRRQDAKPRNLKIGETVGR